MKSSEDVIALFITKYIKTETTMVWVQIGWVGRGRKIILLFIHSFSFFHLLLYVFYSSIPFVLVRFPFPIILFKSHTCFIFRELLKVKAIIKVENITLYVMSPLLPIFNVEISYFRKLLCLLYLKSKEGSLFLSPFFINIVQRCWKNYLITLSFV